MESRVNEKVKSRKCAGLISLRKKPAAFPNEILSFKKKKKKRKEKTKSGKVGRGSDNITFHSFDSFTDVSLS